MYWGSDPRHVLDEVVRGQGELRALASREAGVRRAARSFRRWSPAAFKLWRLHVMVWIEDTRP